MLPKQSKRSAGASKHIRSVSHENQSLLFTVVVDFFELKLRDTLPVIPCLCGSGTREIKLIHPPQVIGGRAHYFDVAPLTITVEKCLAIEDVLKLTGAPIWSTATPAHVTEEVLDRSKGVILEKLLEDLKLTTEPDTSDGHSSCLVCSLPKGLQNSQIRMQSMPEKKDLIEWGSKDIEEKARLFPEDVESVLDALLLKWCRGAGSGRLVSYTSYVSPHFRSFIRTPLSRPP